MACGSTSYTGQRSRADLSQFTGGCGSDSVRFRQGKPEGGSSILVALSEHLAAVFQDDAPHRGEAHPGPLKFPFGMQPLENPEQLLSVPGIEADPVVLYGDRSLGNAVLAPDPDLRLFALR